MSCKGVGSRFSIWVRRTVSKRAGLTPPVALPRLVTPLRVAPFLAAAMLSAGIGCSTAEGAPTTAQSTAAAQHAGEPEQVVQRMAPEPTHPAGSSVVGGPNTNSPVISGRVSSAAGTRVDSRPAVRGEPITSKHLEAELNRLEAELGR